MVKKAFLLFLLLPLWVFLRGIYRDRIGAFGCFDDCFNYMGGYFLLAGKRLYADIFFNHQPLPAYLSALIQWITKPDGIYLLIHQHRMFVVYFSMIADMLLVLRFGLVGFGFAVLYETTKGYVFGERFLAEAMIVYLLVYLLGLIGEVWQKKKLWTGELLVAAVLTWFVVFSREPYVPLGVAMFGYLLWKQWKRRVAKISLALIVGASVTTIGLHSLPDYFFNLVTVNVSRPAQEGGNIWNILFYPVLLFFGGGWNVFRTVEVTLTILFWVLIALKVLNKNVRWEQIILLFILLTLANVRAVAPGEIYYAAFHHIVWYGLFITSVLLLIGDAWEGRRRLIGALSTMSFIVLTVWATATPASYLHEKVDRHAEFTTNFSQVFTIGGIVQTLSLPQDTLFLDGWDDLIYWHAKLYSPYKYAWYTSSMPQFPVYRIARDAMFADSPPDFYYGQCSRENIFDASALGPHVDDYVRLVTGKYPTCVFVHRLKLPEISDAQWQTAKEIFDIQRP